MFPVLFHGGRRRRSWHTHKVPSAVIDNPILNSPFAEPTRHWVLDENGIPRASRPKGDAAASSSSRHPRPRPSNG